LAAELRLPIGGPATVAVFEQERPVRPLLAGADVTARADRLDG
jgi:hypothetical protein